MIQLIFIIVSMATIIGAILSIRNGFSTITNGQSRDYKLLKLDFNRVNTQLSESINELIILKDYQIYQTEYPPNRVTVEEHSIVTLETPPFRMMIHGNRDPDSLKININNGIARELAKAIIDRSLIEIVSKDDMNMYGMGVPPVKLFKGIVRIMDPKASETKYYMDSTRTISHGGVYPVDFDESPS